MKIGSYHRHHRPSTDSNLSEISSTQSRSTGEDRALASGMGMMYDGSGGCGRGSNPRLRCAAGMSDSAATLTSEKYLGRPRKEGRGKPRRKSAAGERDSFNATCFCLTPALPNFVWGRSTEITNLF